MPLTEKITTMDGVTTRRVIHHLMEAERSTRPYPPPRRRPHRGGGGGSSGIYLMKITGLHSDSPVSGVRMYKGDLYENGSATTRTKADVTVRIPGIPANVTLPSSGTWADVPACGGIPITATWTGASQTHTNDTVYESIGLLLIW